MVTEKEIKDNIRDVTVNGLESMAHLQKLIQSNPDLMITAAEFDEVNKFMNHIIVYVVTAINIKLPTYCVNFYDGIIEYRWENNKYTLIVEFEDNIDEPLVYFDKCDEFPLIDVVHRSEIEDYLKDILLKMYKLG